MKSSSYILGTHLYSCRIGMIIVKYVWLCFYMLVSFGQQSFKRNLAELVSNASFWKLQTSLKLLKPLSSFFRAVIWREKNPTRCCSNFINILYIFCPYVYPQLIQLQSYKISYIFKSIQSLILSQNDAALMRC